MLPLGCCFTGHRRLSGAAWAQLPAQLDQVVARLHEEGIERFYCGGALGFDTLAAEAVLRQRQRYPGIELHLILPCRDQASHWTAAEVRRYQRILKAADEITCLSEQYTPACMLARNRRMVELSGICVVYMTHARGGTAYTLSYAKQQGRELIFLADYGEA